MDSNRTQFRACPWCLHAVEHVTGAQYRHLVRHGRNLINIAWVSNTARCWWCPQCHAGGLFVGIPQ